MKIDEVGIFQNIFCKFLYWDFKWGLFLYTDFVWKFWNSVKFIWQLWHPVTRWWGKILKNDFVRFFILSLNKFSKHIAWKKNNFPRRYIHLKLTTRKNSWLNNSTEEQFFKNWFCTKCCHYNVETSYKRNYEMVYSLLSFLKWRMSSIK